MEPDAAHPKSRQWARLDAADHRARRVVVIAARIAAGLLWLANLHWKVAPNFGQDTGGGLFKYIRSAIDTPVLGVWRAVTEHVILPQFHLFGWLVILTDGTIAALLLIGYKTRIVALIGALNSVPIFLSVAYRANEWPWSYIVMFFLHLLLFATAPADQAGSIDTALRGGRPARDRALLVLGTVAVVVGAIGWYLARDVDFATRRVAMFGHARLELKLLWFNGLGALATIVVGALLVAGSRARIAALAAAAASALLALVALLQEHWDNTSKGPPAVIGTGSNAAFWAMFAVAGTVLWFADRQPST